MREAFRRWASGFRLGAASAMQRGTFAVLALTLGVLTAGCGNNNAPTTPTPTTPTGPTTSIFASRLTPGGAVSRSFGATTTGTVTVMLTNAAGPLTRVGLGIGVPTSGIAKCSLSTAINTASGTTPQISAAVDPGQYCVTVYDLGTLTSTIDFSVTLVYP
jgi:hypothetical protein